MLFFLNLDCWGKPSFNWEKLRHLLEIVKSCIIWYIMQHGLKIFIATILSFDFKIPNDLINKFRFQWTSLYYCLLSMSFITFWKFFSVWIVKNTFLPIGIVSYIDPLQTLEKHDTMLYMFSMTKWIALILSWTYLFCLEHIFHWSIDCGNAGEFHILMWWNGWCISARATSFIIRNYSAIFAEK